MADNVAVTPGTGATIAADEVTDGTLGSVKVQYVKLMDGTLDGTSKAAVDANGLDVDVTRLPALPAGTNVIGHVIVDTAPTTAVTGPLTDTQIRATPLPVSGTVTATTGGLTDTQLRATPVPVSGTVTATTGGLTDTQLRATPVPVSGTVTTGGITNTELRASAVPVSISSSADLTTANAHLAAMRSALNDIAVAAILNNEGIGTWLK